MSDGAPGVRCGAVVASAGAFGAWYETAAVAIDRLGLRASSERTRSPRVDSRAEAMARDRRASYAPAGWRGVRGRGACERRDGLEAMLEDAPVGV
ncbi:MAG TPA: hypothetical protein VKG43_08940 [Acidimicrobiales bacterium]|nr:hypothetical protein [Acidimicrobiales bacterium]